MCWNDKNLIGGESKIINCIKIRWESWNIDSFKNNFGGGRDGDLMRSGGKGLG